MLILSKKLMKVSCPIIYAVECSFVKIADACGPNLMTEFHSNPCFIDNEICKQVLGYPAKIME